MKAVFIKTCKTFYNFLKAIIMPWIAFMFIAFGTMLNMNDTGITFSTILLYTIAFIIIEIYGRNFYRFNKEIYQKQTIDIVYDKKTDKLYTLSNDVIDSIVEINADTTEDLFGDDCGNKKLEIVKYIHK